jgi:hypothetical protein
VLRGYRRSTYRQTQFRVSDASTTASETPRRRSSHQACFYCEINSGGPHVARLVSTSTPLGQLVGWLVSQSKKKPRRGRDNDLARSRLAEAVFNLQV